MRFYILIRDSQLPYGRTRQKYNRQLVFNSMRSMPKKARTRLKIIGATATAVFSLASVFTGTYAWFAQQNNVYASAMNIRVASTSCTLQSLKLIKFDYDYDTIGGIDVYDYLNPSRGAVNTYTFNDATGDYEIRDNQNNVVATASAMTKYDPVDRFIHGNNLREMNCNAIYEVVIASNDFSSCYLQLSSILESIDNPRSNVFLSDCVDIDVFYPSDLSNDNALLDDNSFYPSYAFPTGQSDDNIFYKISYLSYLRSLDADGLISEGIIDSSEFDGKTDEQKEALIVSTVGSRSMNFYGNDPKHDIDLAINKSVTFTGNPSKTVTIYINVNYAPQMLEQYSEAIYRSNIEAIYDFYFNFQFTERTV